ncbi:metallophosphoesterase, partial [Peribacillus simplex]
MRDNLIDYLGELKDEINFSFLLLTGDIAHQGDHYNEEVKKFLNDVLEIIDISKKDVHIIPGNHDITRDKMRSLIIEGILGSKNASDELDNVDPKTYLGLLEGQSNFFEFYKGFLGTDYPQDELHFLKSSEQYNIFSMNTCLISHKKGEEGHLLIGRKKFYEAIKDMKKLDCENKINIAIGHHTLNCIETSERNSILANFDDSKIDIYLSGHVHDPSYNVTINSSASPFFELTSGAVVSDDYAIPGFVVVDVDLDNGEAEACYHIWNTTNDYWTVNNQVNRRTKNGKLDFKIERLEKKKENQIELIPEDSIDELESADIDENEF